MDGPNATTATSHVYQTELTTPRPNDAGGPATPRHVDHVATDGVSEFAF